MNSRLSHKNWQNHLQVRCSELCAEVIVYKKGSRFCASLAHILENYPHYDVGAGRYAQGTDTSNLKLSHQSGRKIFNEHSTKKKRAMNYNKIFLKSLLENRAILSN